MRATCLRMGVLGAVLLTAGSSARAQWGFPGGFGDFGWGGWGATTAAGDEARGLGMLAAGLGQYNVNTAQGNAINADTVMRFNEYIWQSQQLRNQRHMEQLANRRERINDSARTVYTRLTTNPERADVHRGDALNVLIDQLTAPGVYSQSVSAARAPLASSLVRNLPFRYAPQAITISLDELTHDVPEALNQARFQPALQAVQRASEQVRAEADTSDTISTASLRALQSAIRDLQRTVQAAIPAGRNRRPVDNFLNASLGLARMLEAPDTSIFLRELNERDSTTLGALLAFMQSFNLRLSAASTPSQRANFDELFTRLSELRAEVFPQGNAPDAMAAPGELHPEYAEEFFSTMNPEEIATPKPLTPAATP